MLRANTFVEETFNVLTRPSTKSVAAPFCALFSTKSFRSIFGFTKFVKLNMLDFSPCCSCDLMKHVLHACSAQVTEESFCCPTHPSQGGNLGGYHGKSGETRTLCPSHPVDSQRNHRKSGETRTLCPSHPVDSQQNLVASKPRNVLPMTAKECVQPDCFLDVNQHRFDNIFWK